MTGGNSFAISSMHQSSSAGTLLDGAGNATACTISLAFTRGLEGLSCHRPMTVASDNKHFPRRLNNVMISRDDGHVHLRPPTNGIFCSKDAVAGAL